MAFERMYEMSATFESYVDHVKTFPDRVKEFARGGRSPQGLEEWFEEPSAEHAEKFGRASMLMNPCGAAKAVMQWMVNPDLKEGTFLPDHMQIAAYLGQHTVRPVHKNEYTKSEDAMGAYWKEWSNLLGKGVYREETLTEWHTVRKEAQKERRGPPGILVWVYGTKGC